MLPHLTTLLLSCLLLTQALGESQPDVRVRPESRRWMHGCWAMLVGLAALAARVVLPLAVSVVLGNGSICLGLAFNARALHRLLCMAMALLALLVRSLHAVLNPEDDGELMQASLGPGADLPGVVRPPAGRRLRLHRGGVRAGGAPAGGQGHP